jgi:hypothetical protein
MESIHSIGVEDALEQLAYPSFFDRGERKAAYDLVMLWGTDEERDCAKKERQRYPFDDPEETLFPSQYTYDFPIVSGTRHV